jgi:hypothetical protein
VSDSVVLFRDIAGDAAQNAAGTIKPGEDRLNQLDSPADDNTWHESPDLSKDKLKNQIKSSIPVGKKDAEQVARDAAQGAHPTGSRDPADVAALAQQEQQQGGSTGLDAKSGAQAGVQAAKNKTWDQMSESDKQKVREYRQKTREYFNNKVPKERREQIVFRLKKMVVEIQGHQDCEYY